MLSPGYKTECLRWRDVEIYWNAGDETSYENLKCTIKLRHTKGHKNELRQDVRSTISPLQGAHLLHLCSMNWLLSLGCRSGNVQATTSSELLEMTLEKDDSGVKWLFQGRPVIPAFARHSSRLFTMRVEEPGKVGAIHKVMVAIANAAGVVGRVGTHHVRRGTIRSLSRLSRKNNMDNREVGEALGHSVSTTKKGTTGLYVADADDRARFEERAYMNPKRDTHALRYTAVAPHARAPVPQELINTTNEAAHRQRVLGQGLRRVEQTEDNVTCEARGVTLSDSMWRAPSPLPPAITTWWTDKAGKIKASGERNSLSRSPQQLIDDKRSAPTEDIVPIERESEGTLALSAEFVYNLDEEAADADIE